MKHANVRLPVTALALLLAACGSSQDQPASQAADATLDARSAAGGGAVEVPRLDWAPCGGDMEGLECATALVPLDHHRPRGERIALALARLRATDPAQRIGSLFFNPGGPGASGIDYLAYPDPVSGAPQVGRLLHDLTGGRFDVVAFDPRGVARSTPLQCFDSLEEEYAWYASIPWAFPYRPEQERPFFEAWRYLAGRCLGAGQPVLGHMSTADVARDLDLLRRAVGDARLTYVGFSYGTYIGETYASLFPDRVRALVLDGVIDPQRMAAGWSWVANAPAASREWAEFLRLCDEAYAVDPARCLLGGPQGSAARFQALLDRLSVAPEPVDGWLTYDVVAVNAATGALYDPTLWADYATWIDGMYQLVFGPPALAGATPPAPAARGSARLGAGPAPWDLGQQYGIQCADAEYPGPFAIWSLGDALADRASFFTPGAWWYNVACAAWPAAADRYLGPWAADTSAPVLVVGNTFDGITGYEGAVAASRLLRGSRLLTYAGWGHCALGKSDCVDGHVAGYLLDGTLPPEGTVCPAPGNPFLLWPYPPPEAVARAQAAAAPQKPVFRPPRPPWR